MDLTGLPRYRTEPGGKHLGGGAIRTLEALSSKGRTGRESQPPGIDRIAGIRKVGMIENIESCRAELQVQALGQPELTMEREVA